MWASSIRSLLAFAPCCRPFRCFRLLSPMVQDCRAHRLPNIHDLITCPGYFWPLWPWLVDQRLIRTAYCKHRSIAPVILAARIGPGFQRGSDQKDYTGIHIMACIIIPIIMGSITPYKHQTDHTVFFTPNFAGCSMHQQTTKGYKRK